MEPVRVRAVGAIVQDEQGRLLLVRRGTEPGRGLWSLPGGRVEPGETPRQAVTREVEEETGLRVVPDGLAGVVERPGPGGVVFDIEDFHARLAEGASPGSARPGDDAEEVGWFAPPELRRLPCVPGLREALTGWGVMPA